jgi:molybdopterin-guanine dinucleotide biosynthesis protein A
MGQDKALLPFGDVPMAARIHGLLSEVFPKVLVVGHADFPLPEASRIPDRHPGRGPLEALASGLEAVEEPQVLLAACDMPFLNPALLRFLAEQVMDAEALVPCSARGPEPLLAVYSRRLLPALRARDAADGLSMRRFLAGIRVREIPVGVLRRFDPELASFRNLNRPEDYHEAIRDLAARRSEAPSPED